MSSDLSSVLEFVVQFRIIQHYVHATALEKGWWEDDTTEHPRNFGEAIALMHSELSEALEFARHGNGQSDHIPEFTGVEEEFADVIIRIMDWAARHHLNVADAIIAKARFNSDRSHKHGGKKF